MIIDTPKHFQKKGRVVQLYAVFALILIGIFAFVIFSGKLNSLALSARQVANVSKSNITNTNNVNSPDSKIVESSNFPAPQVNGSSSDQIIDTENVLPTKLSASSSEETKDDANLNSDFVVSKNYVSNLSIYPTVFKNNVRIYDHIDGVVSVRTEMPSNRAVLLVGNQDGWLQSGIIRNYKKVDGTSRFAYDLDTKNFVDGYYKIGAAYFDSNSGWTFTGTLDFEIRNTKTAPEKVESDNFGLGENLKILKEKPALRLVVDDMQITDLKHVFNNEELELRSTSYPIRSVQFFAYAVDGAFKPALKEIGQGGKDELLSRNGKEVWTYTTDMRYFPTGNYRLFARIHYPDGTLDETQPISIVVEHLSEIKNNLSDTASVGNSVSATASKTDILQRVLDPSACQNRQECEVFCSNTYSAKEKCVNYVRSDAVSFASLISQSKANQNDVLANYPGVFQTILNRVASGTPYVQSDTSSQFPDFSGRVSYVDILPKTIVESIVITKDKFAADIPEEVKTVQDFEVYCAIAEHESSCLSVINKIAPEFKDVLQKQIELVRANGDKMREILEQRNGARVYVDSDDDGVTDYDEINIFGTDPLKRDSNNDGYTDGAAVLGQMAIGNTSNTFSGNIVLGNGAYVENPRITGNTQSSQLQINDVKALEFKLKEEDNKEVSKITFKGKALPNSFIKLFVFSDPIVVTVKADDSGNWSYILDKILTDGSHTSYIAMTDGSGRIIAKSAPFAFTKQGASIISASDNVGAIGKRDIKIFGLSPVTAIALFVGIFGIVLSVIGVIVGHRGKTGKTQ